jgi:hypothetical protein
MWSISGLITAGGKVAADSARVPGAGKPAAIEDAPGGICEDAVAPLARGKKLCVEWALYRDISHSNVKFCRDF